MARSDGAWCVADVKQKIEATIKDVQDLASDVKVQLKQLGDDAQVRGCKLCLVLPLLRQAAWQCGRLLPLSAAACGTQDASVEYTPAERQMRKNLHQVRMRYGFTI